MGTGYVRQASANIVTGNVIEASDINSEFNAVEAAMHESTGHSHDGTTGEGPKISLTGSVAGVLPIANGGTGVSAIGSIPGKVTPIDADTPIIMDSADSNSLKRLTFANLWVWIQSKIAAATSKTTPIDADSIAIVDSAASDVTKRVTFTNLWSWIQSKASSAGLTSITTSSNTTIGGTLSVTGASTLSNNLSVSGTSTLTGNTTVGGTLGVTGATTLSSTLAVTGNTTLSNNLSVSGTSTLTGNTTVGGTLGVTGTTTLAAVSASSLTLTTPLAIAQGGTGSTTAANARTSLFGVSTTTDNAIARYDGTSGALQNSGVTIDDNNIVSASGLTLTDTDTGATAGPLITLYRNSASPAASDILGKVLFQGEDSAGNTEDYSEIYSEIVDTTSGSEDANLILRTKVAGTLTSVATLSSDGLSVTGAIDSTDSSTSRSNLGLGSSGPLSNRNKIINGNFDIWQRGTSGTSGHVADRWQNGDVGSTTAITRQSFALGQTDVPGEPTYFHRSVVTSAAGAANYSRLQQRIESVRTFAGKSVVLSFWAKADATKNIAISFFQYFGTGGSPSSTVDAIGVTTCALTSTWQKFTVTVSIPSISGKTLGTNNNDFLSVSFWFDAGSDFNDRTNSLGQQSGTFDIAQVQLEEGNTATPFEHRSYGQELALCQRYYWRTIAGGVSFPLGAAGGMYSSTGARIAIPFPVSMRIAPTALEQTGTAGDYAILQAAAASTCTAVPMHNSASKDLALIDCTIAGGTVNSYAMLRGGVSTAYLGWSAEL